MNQKDIRRKALDVLHRYTRQLIPEVTILEPPFIIKGDIEGLIYGWMLEAVRLYDTLGELQQSVINGDLEPTAAVAQARNAVFATVKYLRPDAIIVSINLRVGNPGSMATLSRAVATTQHLIGELSALLGKPQEPAPAPISQ